MENTAVKRNKKGFTLVELVIVIAVLAVLAAIAVPTVTNVINSANVNTDKSNAQTIELALKSAYAEAASGTWSGTNPDTLTVDSALQHEGLNSIKDMNSRIKQSGGKKFVYNTSGQILCETPNTSDSTNPLKPLENATTDSAVLVKDAIKANSAS